MFDFGLYTQVSDSGPLGPLVCFSKWRNFTLGSFCCLGQFENRVSPKAVPRELSNFVKLHYCIRRDPVSFRFFDLFPPPPLLPFFASR